MSSHASDQLTGFTLYMYAKSGFHTWTINTLAMATRVGV